METHTPCDIERFIAAQAEPYAKAIAELRARQKQSHRMWFGSPRIEGLCNSFIAKRYVISGLPEAPG